jgi:hypothetical protein
VRGNSSVADSETAIQIGDLEKPASPPIDPTLFVDPIQNSGTVSQGFQNNLPLINNFQIGKYYLQIGSYANIGNVYNEIANINKSLPLAVMRVTVSISGIKKDVYRVLIGPLNYNESRELLQQFRVKYSDAFVWTGR